MSLILANAFDGLCKFNATHCSKGVKGGVKIGMGVFPTIYLLLFKEKNFIDYENVLT